MNAGDPAGDSPNLPLPAVDAVDVWSAVVAEAAGRLEVFGGFVSDDERERAARFHRAQDRTRFVVARGFLRELLGKYLDADPARLVFETGVAGKPVLAGRGREPAVLSFNLAHSGDLVLCAVATGRQVGVDVERIKDNLDVLEFARSQFAGEEIAELEAWPEAERREAFFRVWTRKEAFLKARGDGLGFGLRKFAVTAGPEPRLLRVDGEPGAGARWGLADLAVADGYSAALVVERPPAAVTLRRWRFEK